MWHDKMIIHEMQQQTPEWFAVKKFKFSASNATAIGNQGKGLDTLVDNMILDHIIDKKGDGYSNASMERGNELEPIGRLKYEFEKGVEVREVGFVECGPYFGFSPDGLVGEDGGLEFKCRKASLHLGYLRTGKVESGTVWQMQFSMFASKREWWDFCSYHPDFKQSLWVKRFYPDEKMFGKIEGGIIKGTKMLKEGLAEDVIKKELL